MQGPMTKSTLHFFSQIINIWDFQVKLDIPDW